MGVLRSKACTDHAKREQGHRAWSWPWACALTLKQSIAFAIFPPTAFGWSSVFQYGFFRMLNLAARVASNSSNGGKRLFIVYFFFSFSLPGLFLEYQYFSDDLFARLDALEWCLTFFHIMPYALRWCVAQHASRSLALQKPLPFRESSCFGSEDSTT